MRKTIPKKDVAIIIGSKTDFETIKDATDLFNLFGISYELKILSAHRSPDLLKEYIASVQEAGIKIFIAAAGGAAHLPGVIASMTTQPVIGVPVMTKAFKGVDSVLSILQMPRGIPVATMAVGNAGAKNAAIFAAEILALDNHKIRQKIENFRKQITREIISENKKFVKQ